jgi:cytochrome oxidase Cu insertion factor (SCO1/SenC/PrrC family)
MTRRLFPFVVLFAAGCGAWGGSRTATTPTQPEQPDLDFPVGEFALTERSGKPVTDKDLRGKVWIGSFVFTRCTGPCPAVTNTMARLQAELKDEMKAGTVKLVTFTVDPARDDLKALKDYANSRQADPDNWLFLTGDEKTIHKLLREQFKQAVERKFGPDVQPGDEFGHSTRLILVDKNGVIRGTYDGLPDEGFPGGKDRFETGLVRLRDRARELLKQ